MNARNKEAVKAGLVFGMTLMISIAAQAVGTNGGGRVGSAAPAPAATLPTFQLAMMDDMDNMGGGAMPAGGTMPGGMSAPMADPLAAGTMGSAQGPMQAQRGMSGMPPASRLPGFPGGSHLYHVGASGFFLDHPEHLTLSTAQQTALNRIKEKALLDRANSTRRIEEAEQELWTLTAADAPDSAKIEAKVRAIEKLGGDQRLVVIRAVGEAARVLTPDQQAAVLGTKPPAGSKPAAQGMPAAGQSAPMDTPVPAAPMPAAPMPHM